MQESLEEIMESPTDASTALQKAEKTQAMDDIQLKNFIRIDENVEEL